MIHYMIDIETTDTTPTATVLAIAVIRFDADRIHDRMLLYPSIEAQSQRTTSLDTMRFWMGHLPTFQDIMDHPRKSLPFCLAQLNWFIAGKREENTVWSKSPSFDLAILKDLFGAEHIPWIFRQEQCVRTAEKKLTQRAITLIKSETPHDPLSDATAQVINVQNFLRL